MIIKQNHLVIAIVALVGIIFFQNWSNSENRVTEQTQTGTELSDVYMKYCGKTTPCHGDDVETFQAKNISESVKTQAPEKTGTKTAVLSSATQTKAVSISLPKSDPVPPPAPKTTMIQGLSAIRVGGGIWDNWDSDMEEDGPVIDIVYLDSQGEIITSSMTKEMPITADVKIYAKANALADATKLVFSAHYESNQIILGSIYPKIRIPKEQMSVNPSTDYQYGTVEVTVHTPEQGNFGNRKDFVVLYEK